MSMWQLLAAAAKGVDQGTDALKARQEAETEAAWKQTLRKAQQEQLARAEAERTYKNLQALQQQALQSGDTGTAYGLTADTIKARNAYMGRNDKGPSYRMAYPTVQGAGSGKGDPGGAYVPVSYNDQGQAIEPAKTLQQNDPGNLRALYGVAGIDAPKVQEAAPGTTLYTTGPDGTVKIHGQAAERPSAMAAIKSREEIAKTNAASREKLAQQRIISAERMLGRRLTAQERMLVMRLDEADQAREDTQAHQVGMQDTRLDAAKDVRSEKELDQEQDNWTQHRADFERLFPGVTITSGKRDPFQNLAVGGVPNSYHLRGMALDIVPPPPAERARIRAWAASRSMEVIDEGDHWHLEPRPGGRVPKAPRMPAAAQARAAAKPPTEKSLLEQATKTWAHPYPQDRVGLGPNGKPDKYAPPDGLDDTSGVPLPQAIQAWLTGRDTIYQDLRKKHGYK